MEVAKGWQLWGYMMAISVVAFSFIALNSLVVFYNSATTSQYAKALPPLSRFVGGIVGSVLMVYGRRKMLLITDYTLIIVSFFGCFPVHTIYNYVIVVLSQALYGFAYCAFYLYIKEIPLFLHFGYPIAFLVQFRLLANVCTELFQQACVSKSIAVLELQEWPLRVLTIVVAAAPACIQILLLTFVYRYEPLQYLVSINREDEALRAVPEMYNDPKVGVQHVQALMAKHDQEKHLSIKSWANLLTSKHCLDVAICSLFFFISYHIGLVGYTIPLQLIAPDNAWIYSIIANGLYALWIPVLLAYINCLQIWQLLATGLCLSLCFHGLALWFLQLGLVKNTFFFVSAIFISFPYYACLLVPYARYILRVLSDKGVCLCISLHFMGGLGFLVEVFFCPITTITILLLSGLAEISIGLIIVFFYFRPHENRLAHDVS